MRDDFALSSAYLGGDAHLVTVSGELDVVRAPELRRELARTCDDGAAEIVVDLLKVPFVDSIALDILVDASRRATADGCVLRVVCDDRRIARVVEITGLDRVLRLHTTLREAIESLSSHRATATAVL